MGLSYELYMKLSENIQFLKMIDMFIIHDFSQNANKIKKKRLHIVRICLQDHRLIHPVLVKLNNITTEHAKGCPVT